MKKLTSKGEKQPTPRNEIAGFKLKVLCLHGYRQNEKSFREKTGAFRKAVGKYVDLTFVNAPHEVKPLNSEEMNEVRRIAIYLDMSANLFEIILLNIYHDIFQTRTSVDGGLAGKMIISRLMMFQTVTKVKRNFGYRYYRIILSIYPVESKVFAHNRITATFAEK